MNDEAKISIIFESCNIVSCFFIHVGKINVIPVMMVMVILVIFDFGNAVIAHYI